MAVVVAAVQWFRWFRCRFLILFWFFFCVCCSCQHLLFWWRSHIHLQPTALQGVLAAASEPSQGTSLGGGRLRWIAAWIYNMTVDDIYTCIIYIYIYLYIYTYIHIYRHVYRAFSYNMQYITYSLLHTFINARMSRKGSHKGAELRLARLLNPYRSYGPLGCGPNSESS